MQLSFFVNKSPEDVYAYLADMQRFVSIHPVISKAEWNGSTFLIYETLKIVGIPVSFNYPAQIFTENEDRVTMKATVNKIVQVQIVFELCAENGGTRINETVTFRSILPVHFIMNAIFRKQHQLLFENLNAI